MHRWLRRRLDRWRLKDPRWASMFEEHPSGEVVSVDCETTGFDTRKDDVISIAAIRIAANRIVTSSAFEAVVRPEAAMRADAIRVHQLRAVDVEAGRPMAEVLPEFLDFVGGRPLVGYWIDYDVTMLDRSVRAAYGFGLPNRRIEVSSLYYDLKYRGAPPGTQIDLTFAAISRDLGLRQLPLHDAFNDALTAAEMYVLLDAMAAAGHTIPREVTHDASSGIAH
ncbi:3'-5' exonuclease [Siculibacillus lacustris]|uniref:3'-5' exonuclease n=1 Tax=Siculibacillus lacustris TaxID=1549641 RepID=A0A4Q9VTX1_9HYPH|nr:3'-5' exonuclease [Siculibacillus lacustris]TBW39191.1 3'-5' exonuclease [Siculibacillus lacustris]